MEKEIGKIIPLSGGGNASRGIISYSFSLSDTFKDSETEVSEKCMIPERCHTNDLRNVFKSHRGSVFIEFQGKL